MIKVEVTDNVYKAKNAPCSVDANIAIEAIINLISYIRNKSYDEGYFEAERQREANRNWDNFKPGDMK